jgi:hypothetical protein
VQVRLGASVAETKYPQQLMMDVGDTPGHKIGAFEMNNPLALTIRE